MKNLSEKVEKFNVGLRAKFSNFKSEFKRGLVLFLLPGIMIGVVLGARLFETGNLPQSFLKGSSVYITGVCEVGGKPRLPAFSLDQMTVTSINSEHVNGIITKTREYAECSKSTSTIDSLPYLKSIFQTPASSPELTAAFRDEPKKDLGSEVIDKEFKVTGICTNGSSGSNETLAEAIVVFKSANQDNSGRILFSGIVVGGAKNKGQQVVCDKLAITYSPYKEIVINEQTRIPEGEEDLRGKVVLVTSTCFPDERLEDKNKPKTEQVYYTFLDSPVKVISYKKDGSGKVILLTGISVEKKVAVVCDKNKYDIEVRSFTADMRINNGDSKR